MELTIKTLQGSCVLSGVADTMTVAELQDLLHQQHKDDQLALPRPQQQRLIFKQAVLPADAALQQVGVANGDQLVLLVPQKPQQPPSTQTTPAPDAAAIRTAITEEARRQGTEHTLREERPPAASQRRNMLLTPDMLGAVDAELLNLLEQALTGSAGNLLQQGLQGVRLSGSGDGGQGQGEEEEEEGDVVAAEPSAAHVAQLVEMGFNEPVVRKALVLTRDNIQLALEWILQHGEESGAADPLTQEQLRQVYGRRRRRQGPMPAAAAAAAAAAAQPAVPAAAAGVPVEAVLSQLAEMGFDAAAAQQALSRVGPNLDLAVTLLLGQGLSAALSGGASSSGNGNSSEAAAAPAGRPSSTAAGTGDAAGSSNEVAASVRGEGGQGQDSNAAAGHRDDSVAEPLDEDEEDYDEYEDAAEDEYVDYEDADEDEDTQDGEEPELPLHLEQALGTMGSMDLLELGSADMEQLLQGVAVQDLVGNQLLMAGGMDGGLGGMAGAQGALLRLMEAPGLLQQMMAAVQEPAAEGGDGAGQPQQQQQQQEQQDEQQRHPEQTPDQ